MVSVPKDVLNLLLNQAALKLRGKPVVDNSGKPMTDVDIADAIYVFLDDRVNKKK
jgi:hypothetical protein